MKYKVFIEVKEEKEFLGILFDLPWELIDRGLRTLTKMHVYSDKNVSDIVYGQSRKYKIFDENEKDLVFEGFCLMTEWHTHSFELEQSGEFYFYVPHSIKNLTK